MPASPNPSRSLSASSRRLWVSILDRFDLTDEELATLALALEALDTAKSARRRLRREGLVIEDRFGQPKPHPAAAIARDATHTWAKLMGALDLPDDEDEGSQPRTSRGQWVERARRRPRALKAVGDRG